MTSTPFTLMFFAHDLAVLVGDGGLTISIPASLLPDGSGPGDVLVLSLRLDRDNPRQATP